MGIYQYFLLGIILGFAISLYIFASREENICVMIVINHRLFSSVNLDNYFDMPEEKRVL